MRLEKAHKPNREFSVLAVGLVVYYFVVTALCLYSLEWTGLHSGPIFLVAVVCSVPAVLSLKTRSFDPLEPVWLYSAIFFLEFSIKPLLTLWDPARFGFTMLPLDYETMRVSRSLLIAAGGLLAFYLGYYSVLRIRAIPVYHLADKWRTGREISVFFFGLTAFLYAVFFFFSRAGYSFSAIYQNRAATGGLSSELSFLVHIFGWIAVLIPFRRCLAKKNLLAWCMFAVLLLVVMAGFSIFGARWTLFFIPVSLVVISHYVVARLSAARIAIIFSLVFACSAAFGAFRGNFDAARLAPSATVQNLADEMTAFADWDIFLAIQDFYPEYRPHYNGRLASEAVLWLIPRSIWPGKPIQYGSGRIQDDIAPNLRVLSSGGGYTGTAISQSTLGEGYADFGLGGALLYMAIFGLVWGWVYRVARDNVFSFPMAATYSLMYIIMPLCVRGFASSLIYMGLWGFLVTAMLSFLAGGRRAIA
ncbi:MAG: O-antigen ligase [Elusimicrobia bacterium]|nr:O-antigen ligase [Elusimicrobiota bacterium]